MFGLSGINLDDVEVTRSENLNDFHIRVVFGFDHLEVNGTYAMKGFVGWWTLDSKGEQPFSIKMINATIAYEMKIETVSPDDLNAKRFLRPNFQITSLEIVAEISFKIVK